MNDKNKLLIEEYKSLREKYSPCIKEIKVLFVAESPPKLKKEKLPYFYNEDSKEDRLWRYFNEVLYNSKITEKKDFLERFRDDGYFLIDVFSTRQELCEIKNEKEDYGKITKTSQRLFKRIQKLEPEKVVLLGKRSAKLIAGCLPFGNKNNVEKFKKFVNSSIKGKYNRF